jgi:murein DD-endopeptidase MepM/ murein hydrolase activator NlpD
MSPALQVLHERVVGALRRASASPVVEIPLVAPTTAKLDLSIHNPLVAAVDCRDNTEVTKLLDDVLARSRATYGIGGYAEKRGWYARGEQFSCGNEVRSIHLGVDIWAPATTRVYAPYDSTVHSAQDNALVGDYGPTIILEHSLEGQTFYTLYGHLSRDSLVGKATGARFAKGDLIGEIGAAPINGDWPPHLHFQVMLDMLGKTGDYPGVAAESERELFLTLCPDPNLVLRSPLL